jgi:hypothetical protein
MRRALLVGLFALVIGVLEVYASALPPDMVSNGQSPWYFGGFFVSLFLTVILYVIYFLPIILWAGGRASLQHLVLRLLLVRNKAAPWKYVSFLDEATDRLLLRKVGGGYVFMHRLLLDYFADLQEGKEKDLTPQAADALSAQERQPQ